MSRWIFQGNPDRFNINQYVSENKQIYWTVSRKSYQKAISVGDQIFLWRAKGKNNQIPGVVGKGIINEPCEPKSKIKDQMLLADDLWVDIDQEPDEIKAGIDCGGRQ